MQTQNLLRNEAGSIGDTSRAYATAFSFLANRSIENVDEFDDILSQILIRRENVYNETNTGVGNLWLPTQEKGIKEIRRVLELVSDKGELKASPQMFVDLPTIILYTMLLECDSYREGFAINGTDLTRQVLPIIHQEIIKVCPYQVFIDEKQFRAYNEIKSLWFLLETDSSYAEAINAASDTIIPFYNIFKGAKNAKQ